MLLAKGREWSAPLVIHNTMRLCQQTDSSITSAREKEMTSDLLLPEAIKVFISSFLFSEAKDESHQNVEGDV